MNERQAPELKDDYYIDNFHTITDFVADTYHDLLTRSEQQWLDMIRGASKAAQRLYIRLLTRRGSTFRLSRLSYAEIEDIESAAAELTEHDLASGQPPLDVAILLGCFTKPEIIDLLGLHDLRKLCRVNLTEHLTNCDHALQNRYWQVLKASDQWITLEGHKHWMLMQLCFFGNLYQDSSELVLRQLGTLRYEDYPLDCACRAFTSREQIDAHWRYFECETLYECTDQGNATELSRLADSLPKPCANDVNLRRRLDRIRNRIARQLERLSRVEEATTLYKASVHPPARERRVRILMAKQQWPHALTLARQMCDEAYNESERLTGLTLFARCQQALDIAHIKTRPFKPATTRLVLRSDGSRVEELARRFYANTGACFHTENTLINGVLGLFIWDIMFHPVPGVFFNPFQMAPADFNEPEFCARRADLFARRFAELDDQDSLRARVLESFEQHAGKQNPLVRWQRLSPDMLVLALDRIPRDHWRALFERILADTRENSTGLPDLVLFPRAGGYEFIEIKGPGDALQANQRRWMQYFDQNNIACRLVHVRYRL
ncbi:MAG: VRR-NUC domain-containing protein [Granulosicoccus sp.]